MSLRFTGIPLGDTDPTLVKHKTATLIAIGMIFPLSS